MAKPLFTPLATALALIVGTGYAHAVPTEADVATIVDESGSMDTEQGWLPGMISDLEAGLTGAGVGTAPDSNRYAKVGFGGHDDSSRPDDAPHKHQEGDSDWFGSGSYDNDFFTSGSDEDGYDGIDFFFDNYSLRPGAATNLILATDEDRDVEDASLTKSGIKSQLNGNNALLNAVVDASFECDDGSAALGKDASGTGYVADGSGGFTTCSGATNTGGDGSTESDYVDLALSIGGAAWDLNQLRAGGDTATSFTNAFVDIKVQEIQQQEPTPAPAPAPLALAGIGLAAMGAARWRKAG
ncbi:hypothetical protein [Thiohalorhabdus sp.]|uniref:hypothetical protein n=1 Tax=Thiohalorhabdus sp. TaxID=3094134 RepID=UPI002FC371E2